MFPKAFRDETFANIGMPTAYFPDTFEVPSGEFAVNIRSNGAH